MKKQTNNDAQHKIDFQALKEANERFRNIVLKSPDAIIVTDARGKIAYMNPAAEKVFNRKLESFGGKDFGLALANGESTEIDIVRPGKDPGVGDMYVVETEWLGEKAHLITIRDITERKKAQYELRESQELFSLFMRHSPVYMVIKEVTPTESRVLQASDNYEQMIGIPSPKMIGRTMVELFPPELAAKITADDWAVVSSGTVLQQDEDLNGRNYVTIKFPITRREKTLLAGYTIDITERKQADEALRESEEKYRWVLNNMVDVITVMDMNLHFTYVSPSIMRMRGYTAEEATAQTLEQALTPESLQISAKVFEEEMKLEASGTADPGKSRILELEQYRKDGSIVWMENSLSFMRDKAQKPVGIISVSRDITDRKRTEEALRESEAHYRLLAEHMTDIVWMMDLDLNVTWLSPSAMKARGFSVDEIAALPLDRQLTTESLGIAVNLLGKQMRLEKDGLIAEPDRILSRDLEFYCKDGRIIVLDCTFQFIRDEQGKATGILAEGKDITARKRAEEELQRTLESLRKAFGATVQVMVSAVESRDPYTAGHQIRSADLARAIAMEMGLPQDKIDGIRMAGSIHDIGKLSIPAEILSKPTKLSELEFSLIKEHAKKGYEMLKDVESPWPLAEIVRQHHERMDGSGYPRNLKGDEICMEARILAVADVVEAMASHRPYRPGLGIDAALNEIEKNKGICYDNTVADACLRLFREKGFKLEGT